MLPIEQKIVEENKIMKELMKLIPNQGKDKLDALKEIVWYLGAILLGDDIHKLATYSYHTEYAKNALDVLVKYAQEHSIEDYKKLVEELKKEITDLEDKKTNLSTDISSLEKQKLELEQNISNLLKELSKIDEEVKDLEITKSTLVIESNEVQKSLVNYERTIMSYDNELSVVWENIDEDHIIYELSRNELEAYINSLKRDCCRKLFINMDECDDLFMLHTPGLIRLLSCLKKMSNWYEYIKIKDLLIKEDDWSTNGQIHHIKEAINSIKIPRIISKLNIPTYIIDDNILISNNKASQNGLRELYLQRRLLESIAKQRIAEAQLNMIIRELGKNPSNIELLSNINNSFVNDDFSSTVGEVISKKL